LKTPSLGSIAGNFKVQTEVHRNLIESLVVRSRTVREGTYYIRIHMADYGNSGMSDEAPVELKVQVTGNPVSTEAAAVANRESGKVIAGRELGKAKTGGKVEAESILSKLGNTLMLMVLVLVGIVLILGVLFFTVRRRRT
jgi:hypothetical protein